MSDSNSVSSRSRKGPHRPASRVRGFIGPQRRRSSYRTPTTRSRSRSKTKTKTPKIPSLRYSKPIGPSPKPKTQGWKTWAKSKAKRAGKYAYSRAKSSLKRAGKYAYSRARSKYSRAKSVVRNKAITDLRRVCGKIESLLEKGHTLENIEKKLA